MDGDTKPGPKHRQAEQLGIRATTLTRTQTILMPPRRRARIATVTSTVSLPALSFLERDDPDDETPSARPVR